MKRKLLGRMALVTAAIAASAAVTTGRVSAELRVVSSDANARFMALGVSKSVVIELSTDVKSVVVADRSIATAVALSKRRVEIIGAGLGQTNIYFFDEHDRPIDGLNIAVKDTAQPIGLEDYPYPANVVMVVYGGVSTFAIVPLNCTPIRCLDARKPGADQPPGTENISINSNPNRRSRARQMTAFGAVVKQPLQS
jgi:Pilus formation protein N terminal region